MLTYGTGQDEEEDLLSFMKNRRSPPSVRYNRDKTIESRERTKGLIEQALGATDLLVRNRAAGISTGAPVGKTGGGSPLGSPSNGKTPSGLRPNAARGAQLARQMGFGGSIGGIGKRSGKSDHPAGNAIDLMTNGNMQQGYQLADYYVNNRDQLGVKYVIFNQRIASPSSGWKWRPMADRGSPTANHVDHPHISFH